MIGFPYSIKYPTLRLIVLLSHGTPIEFKTFAMLVIFIGFSLDEPFSNLDISHQFEIIAMLREICENEKKTILLIVHDLNMALRYCKTLLLLHNHSVVFNGKIEEGLNPLNIKKYFGVDASIQNINGKMNIVYN